MSARHPALSILQDMETDIGDVAHWGELLYLLASSPNSIDPGALHVIAAPIAALGKRLDARWTEALEMAGGRP